MAPYLDLIVGMPIQPNTKFRLVHDSNANISVKLPSVPPPAVIVRLPRETTSRVDARLQRQCHVSTFFLSFKHIGSAKYHCSTAYTWSPELYLCAFSNYRFCALLLRQFIKFKVKL
ncbi:hypothetical protein JG687_00008293 [Phytophthora cactorum]|uniref:Uncharacterized protein n=1 Tax=Phytophthora cactorum TaxID=29920 RepID=A0A8T1UFZ0_9STRA|nr:hypothetical protein JG687_00008293 [Phytophthora cactorum]